MSNRFLPIFQWGYIFFGLLIATMNCNYCPAQPTFASNNLNCAYLTQKGYGPCNNTVITLTELKPKKTEFDDDCQISHIQVFSSVVKICNASKISPEDPNDIYISCDDYQTSGSVLALDIQTRMIKYIRCYFVQPDCVSTPCDKEEDKNNPWGEEECARLYNNDNCNKCNFQAYSLNYYGGAAQCLDLEKSENPVENWSLKIRNSSFKVCGAFQGCKNPDDCSTKIQNGRLDKKYDRFSCRLAEDKCKRDEEAVTAKPNEMKCPYGLLPISFK